MNGNLPIERPFQSKKKGHYSKHVAGNHIVWPDPALSL